MHPYKWLVLLTHCERQYMSQLTYCKGVRRAGFGRTQPVALVQIRWLLSARKQPPRLFSLYFLPVPKQPFVI
jgi:hypothetical protein